MIPISLYSLISLGRESNSLFEVYSLTCRLYTTLGYLHHNQLISLLCFLLFSLIPFFLFHLSFFLTPTLVLQTFQRPEAFLFLCWSSVWSLPCSPAFQSLLIVPIEDSLISIQSSHVVCRIRTCGAPRGARHVSSVVGFIHFPKTTKRCISSAYANCRVRTCGAFTAPISNRAPLPTQSSLQSLYILYRSMRDAGLEPTKLCAADFKSAPLSHSVISLMRRARFERTMFPCASF